MSDNSRRRKGRHDREWPEPPPFRPEYDMIVFREGGRWTDPPPTWRSWLRRWIGAFRPYRPPNRT